MRITGRIAAAPARGPMLLSRSILFVEDDDLVRATLTPELEEAGFFVIEAASAEAALAVLERQPVGFLFTDIRLPGRLDGWSLAERARVLHPDLPVVYASGYSSEPLRLVAGGVFLRKPYLPSVLLATLRRLGGLDPD